MGVFARKMRKILMIIRLPTKIELISFCCAVIWVIWCAWADKITHDTYLFDEGLYKSVIVGASFLIGMFIAWRVYLKNKFAAGMVKRLFGVCLTVMMYLTFIFWNVPELLMISSANKHVSDNYRFKMRYPTQSGGKTRSCKAHVIYYDTYLKREIALCHWDDAPSFFYTDYIRVDKLISGMGAQIIYHEAVH
ncbi:hypothetical protein [Citrobacter portucalensis]|uniref:hypothetical protein n=1 Tax=Citrobacter portucalensis TaxID=1639133 RepID=UPI0008F8BDFE|nr:hypothetical protein [Citrobacter portucalensis]OIK40715.1 hypothetical protein BED30_05875 [Citrobacter portucalensis]